MAVAYDDQYFVGEVQEIQDQKVRVKFLKKGQDGFYSWPKRNDIEIVEIKFIFSATIKCEGVNNGRGFFIVDEEILDEEYNIFLNDFMFF